MQKRKGLGKANPLRSLQGRKRDVRVTGLEMREKGLMEQLVEGTECHTEQTSWQWWGAIRGFSMEK